jgi:adenylate kinase
VAGKDDVTGRRPDSARRRPGRNGQEALQVYHSQTKPLLDYYRAWAATGDPKAPKCRRIAGVGSVDDIRKAAFEALQ